VQHCNGVTEFKQVENKASKDVIGNWISVDVMCYTWDGNAFAIR